MLPGRGKIKNLKREYGAGDAQPVLGAGPMSADILPTKWSWKCLKVHRGDPNAAKLSTT